ncbi:MAG: CHAP domain-containing protein [Eubacterium sp.]|nr:CHAP domain-containing protein [Eubacterium sp.]
MKRFINILLSIIISISIIPSFTAYADTAKSTVYLSTPVLSSAYANNAGIVISWGEVKGAENYRVYYKIGNSSWTKIADTASTSYTWQDAQFGTKYTFTVRCTSSDGKQYTSSFDSTGRTVACLSAPEVTSISSVKTGTKIVWSSVSGAEKYKVLRKTNGTSWVTVGTTTSTSLTDTTAKSGVTYTYTVRCITSAGVFTSGYEIPSDSFTFISSPVLSSAYVNNDGTVIRWGEVAGAENYRVYYKIGNSSWTKIADTTSTTYTWSEGKIGTKYTFTVRCINSDATAYTSSFDSAGSSVTILSAPKISSIRAINSGTEITWGKVTNAERYKVFRKTENGSWTAIGTTTSTTFTDTTAAKGTNYSYTIRCITKDGKAFTSGYDVAGKSFTALTNPNISSISVTATGVKIVWGAISKAEKYRVYRKTTGTGWTALTTTASTTFTDTTAKSGTKYTYTVRCLTSDEKVYTSGYNTTGKSITYVAAPKISSISATSTGIKINWGKVTGADKYKVFRKAPGDTSWTAIGTTAYTDFTDVQAKKGTKYTYTVRCVNSSVTAYTSSFDATGKSATSVSSPQTKNDMVATAEKQLGYSGGKKVWSWAGYSRRVPWCNLFIAWCANELGYYQSGRIPLYQAPADSADWFKARGLFKDRSYIPKPGDLIYYVTSGSSRPYHAGIVEKYENGRVYTIEGNLSDVVQRRDYSHTNSYIYGYATPDYGHN